MISVEPCVDPAIIQRILYHPQVMHGRSLSDGFRPDGFAIPTGLYLLARSNGVTMGIFLLHVQKPVLLQEHIAFLPEFWGRPTAQAPRMGIRWLAENTEFQVMFCLIPEFNSAAIAFVQRTGWEACGEIPKAVLKREQWMSEFLFRISICGSY